jgi:hypothetical protein
LSYEGVLSVEGVLLSDDGVRFSAEGVRPSVEGVLLPDEGGLSPERGLSVEWGLSLEGVLSSEGALSSQKSVLLEGTCLEGTPTLPSGKKIALITGGEVGTLGTGDGGEDDNGRLGGDR